MQKPRRKHRTSGANQSEYLFTQLQIQSINTPVDKATITLQGEELLIAQVREDYLGQDLYLLQFR
jgi:hypothetical protein